METIVQEAGIGKFTQEIIVGNHVLIADEPTAVGGNNLGPSPYDFLLAALGSCTAMTLRMYADFKKIPLQKVIVKLTHDKVYSDDCHDCEESSAKIDQITRVLEFVGDLSSEQKSQLLEIANKCPVHKTLSSKILIVFSSTTSFTNIHTTSNPFASGAVSLFNLDSKYVIS